MTPRVPPRVPHLARRGVPVKRGMFCSSFRLRLGRVNKTVLKDLFRKRTAAAALSASLLRGRSRPFDPSRPLDAEWRSLVPLGSAGYRRCSKCDTLLRWNGPPCRWCVHKPFCVGCGPLCEWCPAVVGTLHRVIGTVTKATGAPPRNNKLVKSIKDLREKREELKRPILREDEDKVELEAARTRQ